MLTPLHTAGYAIKALGCLMNLGARSGFIADAVRPPRVRRPYRAKNNLRVRPGLVISKRRYPGGIAPGRPLAGISLLQAVEAEEGRDRPGPCQLAPEEWVYGRNCPPRAGWKGTREHTRNHLHATTPAAVIASLPVKNRNRQDQPGTSREVEKPGNSPLGKSGSSDPSAARAACQR